MIKYKTAHSIIIAFFCFYYTCGWSQIQNESRKINLTDGDSSITTAIWERPLKGHIRPDNTYYWYYAGTIHHNLGGISGKPLHGKYELYDSKRRLIMQGYFQLGLKTGNWTRWYDNGMIKESYFFKNGKLKGQFRTFDTDGRLLSASTYKDGILHGKAIYYAKDTTIVKRYREGKELIKKAQKKQFANTKIEKSPQDSEQKNEEKYAINPRKHKMFSWIKSLFTKKEKEIKKDQTSIPAS